MTADRRNPYLILGLPYGATKEEARKAMARVTRRVKGDPSSPYSIEDVTWALHTIEQVEQEPEAAVTIYRVPSNPAVFASPSDAEGLFNPAAKPMDRWTDPPTDEEYLGVATSALRELASALLGQLDGSIELYDPYAITEGGTGEE